MATAVKERKPSKAAAKVEPEKPEETAAQRRLRELEQISDAHGGLLRPEDVVEFARSRKSSALHSCFEWDDGEAAHQYRLNQARQIINVHVKYEPRIAQQVRVFVSVDDDRKNPGGGYRRIEAVMADDAMRASLLRQAKSDFRRLRNQYRALTEFASVFDAIDAVLGDAA